ncbi:ShlB/FhaC/HecB family hemolysin secretion/activation protein [Ramlibacter sp. AN1015]|uniref:ShlB/FhaC/HecB family hemolysin secretion/activation protein n=1 Tax=Ramlibacter sp. AN1015 TaxID=3133428 RepID=UPI0030BC9D62
MSVRSWRPSATRRARHIRLFATRPAAPREWIAAALCGLALASHAQVRPSASPAAAIEEGLRRQEERTREQVRSGEPSASELRPQAAPPTARTLPVEQPCFVVEEVALTGTGSTRFRWLLDAAEPFLRHCVGVQGLGVIASELDRALREAGYATTRVALPAQNLRGRQLLVHVDVGRIGEVRMVDAQSPPLQEEPAWGTWHNAFPTSAGRVLNIQDLEQGVENMNRLPSQSVTTRLEPGEQPGTSDLIIERQAAPLSGRVRAGASLDNGGSHSLGRTQLAINLALDNALGLSDIVSFNLNTNVEKLAADHRSQSAALNYSIPLGYSVLTLSADQSRFVQTVQGTTARFLSSGRSESAQARLQHTLWRTSSSQFGLQAGLSTRRAASFLDDTEILVQRRRTTTVETGASYKHVFEKSVLDLNIAYRRGMPWRRAQADLEGAQEGGPTLRPRIWTLAAGLQHDFTWGERRWRFSPAFNAQHTTDTTLSIDQIAIGGRSSVRGFDGAAVLLAENGYLLRNELTTSMPVVAGMDTILVLALDHGRVWGPSDVYLVGNSLSGAAVGVRGRRESLQFEVMLAIPVHKPDGFATRRVNPYLRLSLSF